MRLDRFEITSHVLGFFRLDGGAMFGSVPKNIWAKRIPSDEENCIPLAARSLLIRDGKRVFLVDAGLGEKWGDKQRQIFAIQNRSVNDWGFSPAEVTDLILTHLHFDHAGGVSRYDADGELELCYPDATTHLQRANWENARNPTLKERASYLKENVEVLAKAKLNLVDGSTEIHPEIWVHRVDGHTRGQQVVEVRGTERSVFFGTDLIPTSRHLPLPFHMGYDACAETLMREKDDFLKSVLERDSLLVFQHDPDTAAGRVGRDERGQYKLEEAVTL